MLGSRKTGTGIINDAVGKFKGIIDKLAEGIGMVETERQGNNDQIVALTNTNNDLTEKLLEAETFKGNLQDMIGQNEDS